MTALAIGLLALVPAQDAQKGIWDRLKFDAEGRMRGEATLDNVDATSGDDIDDRYRGRFRFRIGARYLLTDQLTVIGRVSTASDGNDANNPHWDFGDGDGFSGSGMVADRFYLDWRPVEDVSLYIGKQPHAFVTPGIFSGDIIWDSDVSPAGVAAKWSGSADDITFDARGAAYVATEVGGDDDPKMIGGQGNLYLPIDDLKLHFSSSFYDWLDTDDTAVAGNQGNSATTEDFFIWESFAKATLPGGPLDEMSAYVEFMRNLDENENGVAFGGQFGSSKWQQGNVNLFAVLYSLDGDAIFSPVAQDDTPIAGTGLNDGDGDGMDGLIVGGAYFLRDNICLRLWALTSDPDGADDDPIRLRFDLDFRIP